MGVLELPYPGNSSRLIRLTVTADVYEALPQNHRLAFKQLDLSTEQREAVEADIWERIHAAFPGEIVER